MYPLRLLLLAFGLLTTFYARAEPGSALLLEVRGAIGPATSDYVQRGLEEARTRHSPVVILKMDTPGGLDSAMREIIRAILASPIPVITYVAPSGARAASAGTYILYASHVAAMAPGTNLGAATPVSIGALPGSGAGGSGDGGAGTGKEAGGATPAPADTMKHKMVNDAAAYIRSLAELRGRNVQWAEQAVRRAASLSAADALKDHVIDLLAANVPQLLAAVDGRRVQVAGAEVILHTRGLAVEVLAPDWRTRLLGVITDPNVAYILMLVGIYGLIFEFANPGYVLPGVAGAISLLLALYAFQVLPVNYAGLGLLLLGVLFMVAEVFVPSFGALGVGGVLAFVIGSVFLFGTGPGDYGVAYPLIAGVALASALFLIGAVGLIVKARRGPVVSGHEELLQSRGEVLEDFHGLGKIRIHGEIWSARCAAPLHAGERVRVLRREGLTLIVEPQAGENADA